MFYFLEPGDQELPIQVADYNGSAFVVRQIVIYFKVRMYYFTILQVQLSDSWCVLVIKIG